VGLNPLLLGGDGRDENWGGCPKGKSFQGAIMDKGAGWGLFTVKKKPKGEERGKEDGGKYREQTGTNGGENSQRKKKSPKRRKHFDRAS